MPAGYQQVSNSPFKMIVRFRHNPDKGGIIMKPCTHPETGTVAETYYRAMHYVKMWNEREPQYKHALYIEKSDVKKHQKTFDLDAEALYGYEDIEL